MGDRTPERDDDLVAGETAPVAPVDAATTAEWKAFVAESDETPADEPAGGGSRRGLLGWLRR